MIKFGIFGMLLLLAGGNTDFNKQSFNLSKDNASIMIGGTSTLHDWTMHLKTFDCNANFVIEGSHLESIDKATFNCKTTDLESESSLMDKKARSALKSDSFPEIRFVLTSPLEVNSINNKFSGRLEGNLFIAGKSEAVPVPVNGSLLIQNGTNIVKVDGELKLKMSDFNITPPVFMMGALKTGDAITISFSMQFFENPKQ